MMKIDLLLDWIEGWLYIDGRLSRRYADAAEEDGTSRIEYDRS
ncbi:hypothetical protein [Raoultibacter massiliensis]|uniref:Uncharacterized protein n=1 Tax=Raoultibacter massiliensis TaxID=1852371 RepID=A0ABV1JG99_9ACTN